MTFGDFCNILSLKIIVAIFFFFKKKCYHTFLSYLSLPKPSLMLLDSLRFTLLFNYVFILGINFITRNSMYLNSLMDLFSYYTHINNCCCREDGPRNVYCAVGPV